MHILFLSLNIYPKIVKYLPIPTIFPCVNKDVVNNECFTYIFIGNNGTKQKEKKYKACIALNPLEPA